MLTVIQGVAIGLVMGFAIFGGILAVTAILDGLAKVLADDASDE